MIYETRHVLCIGGSRCDDRRAVGLAAGNFADWTFREQIVQLRLRHFQHFCNCDSHNLFLSLEVRSIVFRYSIIFQENYLKQFGYLVRGGLPQHPIVDRLTRLALGDAAAQATLRVRPNARRISA
jgi:hypothetical protein